MERLAMIRNNSHPDPGWFSGFDLRLCWARGVYPEGRTEPKEKPHIYNATWDQTVDASIVGLEKMWYGIIDQDREKGRIKAGTRISWERRSRR